MSNELDYIKELGIGVNPEDSDTEASQTNEPNQESNKDFVQEPEANVSNEEQTDTAQLKLMESLEKQIEGMEKRLNDKDDYIKSLQEKSKAEEQTTDTGDTEEATFWDDPESVVNDLKETIEKQNKSMKIQSMQIQEINYASTVDDYWKTVKPDVLNSAVATDPDFADKFRGSSEPYKVAYEYLKQKTDSSKIKENNLRESIKAELLKEMGLDKKKKDVPPVMNAGSSNSDKSVANADGFASVFGQDY